MLTLIKRACGSSVVLALAVVMCGSFMPRALFTFRQPTATERPPISRDPSSIRTREVGVDALRPDVRERWRENIAKAVAKGYRELETRVISFEPTAAQSTSVLDFLFRVEAQTNYEYFSGGMLIYTVLDDSNYSNAEYYVHYIDAIS